MAYGRDAEQRQAIGQKAQDAYALARRIEGQVSALTVRIQELEAELSALRAPRPRKAA